MPRYIELKLASGMVAPHRAKDLVDVQELIRSADLSRDVAMDLHPWVRDKSSSSGTSPRPKIHSELRPVFVAVPGGFWEH